MSAVSARFIVASHCFHTQQPVARGCIHRRLLLSALSIQHSQIIWPDLEKRAPSLYATIKQMEFSYDEYFHLLQLYKDYSAKAAGGSTDGVWAAACAWLKEVGSWCGIRQHFHIVICMAISISQTCTTTSKQFMKACGGERWLTALHCLSAPNSNKSTSAPLCRQKIFVALQW